MGKPSDTLTGAYLQKLLREWLAADPSRTEVDFGRLAGLSKATINNVKNTGTGAGFKAVSGFARALGKTVPQIYAEAEGASVLSAFVLRNLPGWEQMRAKISATARGRHYSDAAWRAAGNTPSPQAIELDEFQVQQLVEWWNDVLPSAPDSDLKAS